MVYEKRHDGREHDQTRDIEIKAGVIANADGSCYFKIGDTIAYCSVYGPRELHPRFLQDPAGGVLRCNYNMMPFSGIGDRVRPGGSRRSKEISMVMEKSLNPVVDLSDYPNSVVDIFVELPQTDAGSRCAAICAASVALADAGIPMKDMIASVSAGKVGDQVLIDLDYEEEAFEDGPVADIPVAFIPSTGKLTLLQMDGEITREELKTALELGKQKCSDIYKLQKQALKEKYSKGDKDE
ncbi:MAG: exosome complex exonuclease Rrp41 [Nanobdellota archaeon]